MPDLTWDEQAETEAGAWHAVFSEPGVEEHTVEDVRFIVDRLPDPPLLPLVEIGCGVGRLTRPVQNAAKRQVVAWDISPNMVRWAKARRSNAFIYFEVGDFDSVADSAWIYGGGWSMLTFQHLHEATIRGYMLALADKLVPHARFVFQFVVPIGNAEEEHHSQWDHRYSIERMATIVEESGMRALAVEPDDRHAEWAWMTVEPIR